MAFYYVKHSGTAGSPADDAGRSETRLTGAWSDAASYPDLEGVLDGTYTTTNIAAGDTVCLSHLHRESRGTGFTYPGIANAAPLRIESVDDTARDALKKGARETGSGSSDMVMSTAGAHWFWSGVDLELGDNLTFSGARQRYLFRDCRHKVTDNHASSGDGLYFRFEDAVFEPVDSASAFLVYGGNTIVEIIGGTTTGFASPTFLGLGNAGGAGGVSYYIEGFDFTNLATTGTLIGDFVSAATDDTVIVKLYQCERLSGQTIFGGTPLEYGSLKYLEAVGCDSANPYDYEFKGNFGQVLDNTSVYVTSDTQLEGSTNYSYQINTTANCSKTSPFRWRLPVGYADLSVATTDTIRIRIATSDTVTKNDIVVIVGTSDGTTNTQHNLAGSAEDLADGSTWIMDHIQTAATLTTDASTWTGLSGETEYAITINPNSIDAVDATSPIAPNIWIEVYGDFTFYLSSQLVFEA